jgi:DNA-binding transcriptional ArsR family regulator
MDGYERLSEIHKALGHPARLQILEVLRLEGEACVCHLEAALGQRQAYISQQLMRLRDAGLVIDRRDGLNVFYSLAGDAVGALLDAARDAGLALAGESLAFADPGDVRPAVCPCPKCAEKTANPAEPLPESARN